MKNDRLDVIFKNCASENRAALIIFSSIGFPSLEASERAVESAIAAGADIIELGVPFSDPMADGKVICEASRKALENGINLNDVIALAARVRQRHSDVGLIIFSYMNVLFSYGLERVCAELEKCEIDGILAVDLPLEERSELSTICKTHNLHLIPLVAPVTPFERTKKIVEAASGFIYYVSVCGTTGARSELPKELAAKLDEIKSITSIPVAAGFGIANGKSAHTAACHADGVISGSAFVKVSHDPALSAKLVRELREGVERSK